MGSLRQSIVIAFCLWHMAGVAAYALPDNLKTYPPIGWLHGAISDYTNDYVRMTSQWQKWPLFAPDPLRRTVVFVVEAQIGGEWRAVKRVGPETVHWRNASAELKTIRRLEEKDTFAPIRRSYALEVCRTEALPPGTPVRLRIDYFIIPKLLRPMPVSWWQAWEPEWQTKIDAEAACPDVNLDTAVDAPSASTMLPYTFIHS